MRFSEYIAQFSDPFKRAGDAYEDLPETSKQCIDSAVERYIQDELKYTKLLKRKSSLLVRSLSQENWLDYSRTLIKQLLFGLKNMQPKYSRKKTTNSPTP